SPRRRLEVRPPRPDRLELEDVDRGSDRYQPVEQLQVVIVHAHAAVTHGVTDGALVVEMRAVDQVAVAGIQLVGTERVRYRPLRRAERWHEDLAVEDDLVARRERPEVAGR